MPKSETGSEFTISEDDPIREDLHKIIKEARREISAAFGVPAKLLGRRERDDAGWPEP